MTKKEAINELIAFAVCTEPKLHCDDDCPYYKEEKFSLKRDSDIFDMIDLEKSDEQFFDTFKNFNNLSFKINKKI